MSSVHTVRLAKRAAHWIASIYIATTVSVFCLALLAAVAFGVFSIIRHISAAWVLGIAFIAWTWWAVTKVDGDGFAWERKEALSDDQGVSK